MNIKNIIKMTLYKNIIKINRFRGIHLLLLYIYTLLVCLFTTDKRQNGHTDRAQICCGTLQVT